MIETLSLFGNEAAALPLSPANVTKSALIEGEYRYRLNRSWKGEGGILGVIMLNPSTADVYEDDATIRRLYTFARRNGFPGFQVVNLFGLRSTDPANLLTHPEPVGPGNDFEIRLMLCSVPTVLCAWGACSKPLISRRAAEVSILLTSYGTRAVCLGQCKDGSPRHPLYVASNQSFIPFDLAGAA